MGEQLQEYSFTHQELVEILIKKQDLHEGIWMLNIAFGIGAINVQHPDMKENNFLPAAVIPISSIGLRKTKELNSLALDAAVVNPLPPKAARKRKRA